jgi:MFS family permease
MTTTAVPVRRTHREPDTLGNTGLITVLLGAALPMIDFFIVNVALPTIDHDLHASPAELELVVAGYGIAYALLLVLGGRLGDTVGRRRMFRYGLAAFTVTSLACGLAPTAGTLVAARIAQGAAAALMLPQVLSTIQATTSGAHRARALGRYGAVGGISTVVGQLAGGLLVSANLAGTGWRPIFLVNVPVGLAGLLLARRSVPETRASHPTPIDLPGTALLGLFLFALLVPLMEGRTLGWPLWTWVLLAASPLLGAAFLAVERRTERAGRVPLLPPSLLRLPSMRRGLSVALPFFTAFGGFMFVYALAFQDGLRLGPLASGLALTPFALGFFVTSLASGRLVGRLGSRVVPVGALVNGVGMLATAATVLLAWPHVGVLTLAPALLVAGLGQGMCMMPLFRIVLSQVPSDRAGAGSGALATTQQTSLALGVAVLGTLFVTLSQPGALGLRDAFALILLVQVAIVGLIALMSRALPDPR